MSQPDKFQQNERGDDSVTDDGTRRFAPLPLGIMARLRGRLGEDVYLVVVAILAGCLIGCAAWALKWLIARVSDFSINCVVDRLGWWTTLLLPLVGILLASIYQRYVIHREIYHGVDRLQADLAAGRAVLPVDLTFSPILACAATLGFGGSAGSEGPIAYAGAAISNNVGRLLGASDKGLRTLMAIGAGAGIAGIFQAPVGGALFTFECLGVGGSPLMVIALFAACLCAGLTASALAGFVSDISFAGATSFSWQMTLPLMALAVFCGIYSAYYSDIMKRMTLWFEKMRSPWTRNVVSGLIVGALLFAFPALFGEGYGVVGHLLNGDTDAATLRSPLLRLGLEPSTLLLVVCLGIMLVKAFATSSTNSGGGVAGDFAPTLFVGAVCGFFFAKISGLLFGVELPVADFVCYGMAAVMAGAVRAPLMAMFLVTEMTGQGGLLLPVAIAAGVSCAVAKAVESARH